MARPYILSIGSLLPEHGQAGPGNRAARDALLGAQAY